MTNSMKYEKISHTIENIGNLFCSGCCKEIHFYL